MRYKEFMKTGLRPYRVLVQLSDYASAETVVYATSFENAIMLAKKQYGDSSVITTEGFTEDSTIKPNDLQSSIQYWGNRWRKYQSLASKPSDDYLTHRMRAQKAKWELARLLKLR